MADERGKSATIYVNAAAQQMLDLKPRPDLTNQVKRNATPPEASLLCKYIIHYCGNNAALGIAVLLLPA
jgi:hypothetical protein